MRDVVLFREQLGQTGKELSDLADDVGGLVGDLSEVRQRLARLEGFIEGAAAASGARPQLPRE